MEDLKHLKCGDIVDIAISDVASGKAEVVVNNAQRENLVITWLDGEPTECYPNSTYVGGDTIGIAYSDIADIRIIKDALEDIVI